MESALILVLFFTACAAPVGLAYGLGWVLKQEAVKGFGRVVGTSVAGAFRLLVAATVLLLFIRVALWAWS